MRGRPVISARIVAPILSFFLPEDSFLFVCLFVYYDLSPLNVNSTGASSLLALSITVSPAPSTVPGTR